jgi:hypothetical protein
MSNPKNNLSYQGNGKKEESMEITVIQNNGMQKKYYIHRPDRCRCCMSIFHIMKKDMPTTLVIKEDGVFWTVVIF